MSYVYRDRLVYKCIRSINGFCHAKPPVQESVYSGPRVRELSRDGCLESLSGQRPKKYIIKTNLELEFNSNFMLIVI